MKTRTLTHHYGTLSVTQLPCLSDNYAFILREEESGKVAVVDTPDADAIAAFLTAKGWGLDYILNTHWHMDHTGGNEALKAQFGATIIGPADEGDRIPARDQAVIEGDHLSFGVLSIHVMDTPGHTKGHISYHLPSAHVAFVGDTLFSLGCGRLFEGTPDQMWESLLRLRALPSQTTLYCAHEYTQANMAFAISLEPHHQGLLAKRTQIEDLRSNGEPTVPMLLSEERSLNPFLRADDPSLAEQLGMTNSDPISVFTEIRARKDKF